MKAEEHVECALSLARKQRWEEAIRELTSALEIAPDALTYNDRGIARAETGDDRGAIEDFTKALELDSSNSLPLINRGNCKYALHDRAGAIADYRAFLERVPDFPHADRVREMLSNAERPLEAPTMTVKDVAAKMNPSEIYKLALARVDLTDAVPAMRKHIDAEGPAPYEVAFALAMHLLEKNTTDELNKVLEDGTFANGSNFGNRAHVSAGAAGAFTMFGLMKRDAAVLRTLFGRLRPGIMDKSIRDGIVIALDDERARGSIKFALHILHTMIREAKGDEVKQAPLQGVLMGLNLSYFPSYDDD